MRGWHRRARDHGRRGRGDVVPDVSSSVPSGACGLVAAPEPERVEPAVTPRSAMTADPDATGRSKAKAESNGTGRAGRARHVRASPWRGFGLPAGFIGILVGCLIPWRDALHSDVFDDTFWHQAAGVWMLDHH